MAKNFNYKIPPNVPQQKRDEVRRLRQQQSDVSSNTGGFDSFSRAYLALSGDNGKQKKIQFDAIAGDPVSQPEGLEWWNGLKKTKNIATGLGPVLQTGLEDWFWGYNDTGVEIGNGSVVHPVAGATDGLPHVELAISNTFEGIDRDIWVATMTIPVGSAGIFTKRGDVNDIDTSLFTPGDNIWVSDTVAGEFTKTKPEFPSYPIQVGGVAISHASAGAIVVSVKGEITDTVQNFWNGVIRESFDFLITATGGVITGTLTPSNGHPDLTMMFSDGFTTLDTDPGAPIELVPASLDTDPVTNFVYIPLSTKVLTVSTSDWPTEEHIKISQCVLQTAITTETNKALRNQNWNDHIQSTTTNQGHLPHIGARIRALVAEWDTGGEATLTGPTSSVLIATTEAKVFQMHLQTFPAQDMGVSSDIHVVNDSITPYVTSNDLANNLDLNAIGETTNNKWFSIVIWGVCNKTGEVSHLMCNLPTGGYNSQENAVNDGDGYAVYDIPKAFKGVGFLIARFTLRRSSSTFTYDSGVGYQDLRGFFPNSTAGSASGSSGVSTFLALTDTPASFVPTNWLQSNAGGTALENIARTAANVPITDVGGIIAATEVEGALQENRTAINLNTTHRGSDGKDHSDVVLNTSKETNVTTDLSEGTANEVTVDVNSSDGTNATLVSASTSRAGLLTKAKWDEIVANVAKISYTDAVDVGLNTTHRGSDGKDHSDVVANTAASHAESHTIASHSDTNGTGAELDELTDGSETTLHSHAGGAGSGDVVGPAGATNNAIARYDGITGKIIKNSSVFIDDNGNLGAISPADDCFVTVTAGNNKDAGINLFADRGDNNYDKWRIKSSYSDNFLHFQTYGTGSWTTVFYYNAATNQAFFQGTYNPTFPRISFDGDGDTGFSRAAADEIAIVTGGVERIRIDSDGIVGIGTSSPNSSSILDLSSTVGAFMPPRMTTTQRDALTPALGMMIYNTTTGHFEGYIASDGPRWATLS